MAVVYPGGVGITTITDTELEASDATFPCMTIAGAAEQTDYSDIKRGILEHVTRLVLDPQTLGDGDLTPDVTGGLVFNTQANTGATAITTFDGAVAGQVIVIIGTSATNPTTIADGGNFNLTAAFTAAVDSVLGLYCQGTDDFIELFRSVN